MKSKLKITFLAWNYRNWVLDNDYFFYNYIHCFDLLTIIVGYHFFKKGKYARKKIFTVLILTYNMEKWIGETIESVLKNKNSKKYIDILVINDGSTDNTINVVKTY